MTRAMQRSALVLISLCLGFAAVHVYAQESPINAEFIREYGLRNLESAVVIRANPESPGAGESVHLSAESPVHDLSQSTITWLINGKKVASGVGILSIDTNVDGRGTPLSVVVRVIDPVWGEASAESTITPLQLDILYDAPNYVPPFYRGRSLPSAGGVMHIEAITRFVEKGTRVSDRDVVYTWSRNGRVLGNISGAGKSKITIDAPALYSTDTISVRASSADETLSAVGSIVIPNTDVTIGLYEDHPLYGFLFNTMLGKNISLPGNSLIAAFPYFVSTSNLTDPALSLDWTLDNAPLIASSTKRNEIIMPTLEDTSTLRLTITHAVNFFLEAVGSWKLSSEKGGGGSSVTTPSEDAFHKSQL